MRWQSIEEGDMLYQDYAYALFVVSVCRQSKHVLQMRLLTVDGMFVTRRVDPRKDMGEWRAIRRTEDDDN